MAEGKNQEKENLTKHQEGFDKQGLFYFVFSMVFVFVFFIYISTQKGIDLKEIPAEGTGPVLAKAFDSSAVAEPWADNPDMVTHGKKVFTTNCAVCHGNEGKGDGPGGAGLNPKPRNLQEGPFKMGGDSIGLFKSVSEGLPGTPMAPFKHLAVNDRWAIVQFIHSINKARVKDDLEKLKAFGATAQ